MRSCVMYVYVCACNFPVVTFAHLIVLNREKHKIDRILFDMNLSWEARGNDTTKILVVFRISLRC
jgi:hypothetical protein